jgi:hypothetical protein
MLLRLAAALSDADEHDAAIAAAERLIALDPLREDGHRLLMQLFASVGRRAEAVRQFAICKDGLRRKLDVAPDAKTIALAQAIQAEAPAPQQAALRNMFERRCRPTPRLLRPRLPLPTVYTMSPTKLRQPPCPWRPAPPDGARRLRRPLLAQPKMPQQPKSSLRPKSRCRRLDARP